MSKPTIKKGEKFNRLTAVKFDHRGRKGEQYWLFLCDCGNEKVIAVNNVKRGTVKSCGCLWKETMTTHNMSYSKEYKSWQAMKDRCYNKNNREYKNYGGRGIKVCKQWLVFDNFYEDMGESPKRMTLDRINNNGNYEPSNCRWATIKEQANNKRSNHLLTYKDKTMTIAQWGKLLNFEKHIIRERLKRGWSVEKIFTTPVRKFNFN